MTGRRDHILAVNAGSSSVKLAAFDATTLVRTATIELDVTAEVGHATALANGLHALESRLGAVAWRAIGHRVTNGGTALGPQVIDAAVVASLARLAVFAPLHQPHNLAGIEATRVLAPGALQVACYDTAFHRTLPDVARHYAIPRAFTDEGIAVCGYHGLSYEHIARVLPDHLGERANGRVIVAHLGAGASMCALRARVSIATTMGLTPLDGLPMATRCGAIDPGAILYLLEHRGMSVAAVRELLYERSGLLGLSGTSGSMKVLLADPSRDAAQAIELFVYRAACTIGSLAASLDGLDAIVFTGGIGENSSEIRERISTKVAWLGASSTMIATDEELVIARHTRDACTTRDREGAHT